MKKLFVILLLAVTAFVVWNTVHDKKPPDQAMRPAEPDFASSKQLEHPPRPAAEPVEDTGKDLTSIVITNYGADGNVVLRTQAVPVDILSSRRPTWWEMKEAGEPLRQKFRTEGTHQEMFAQEEEWREKFKKLKKGMTPEQAFAAMGSLPTQAYAAIESEGTKSIAAIPTNALQNVIGEALAFYSPDGLPPMEDGIKGPRLDRLPFDFFILEFGWDGTLVSMTDMYEDPGERWRRELSENPGGREILAKEAEWKEKSQALKVGMTGQEVIAVMGNPTQREQMPSEIGGQTFFYYFPEGPGALHRSSLFSNWFLEFDGDGKLKEIR